MPNRKTRMSVQSEWAKGDGTSRVYPASSIMEDSDTPTDCDGEQTEKVDLSVILKELRDFRKDNSQQLKGIREDIFKTNTRIAEAEERIDTAETRIQATEEAVMELLNLQIHLDAKLTDLEGQSRRDNIRIHGVNEGDEENSLSMVEYVERLLQVGLELPASFGLRVERAHRAIMTKPPPGAPPRSIVAKLSSYRMKDEILRRAWQKRGFQHLEKRVNLDHDYAPDVLKQRREYAEAKSVLKGKNIRFQTPFPARLRVFYPEGTVLYGSVEEATGDMAVRGFPVTIIKQPVSLMERVQRLRWRMSGRQGARKGDGRGTEIRERLQAFRRQDPGEK